MTDKTSPASSAASASPSSSTPPVCAVVGVGPRPGNGASLARRFAAEGYAVALLARRPDTTTTLTASLPAARAYACDVADPASVSAAFASIRRDLGEIDVLIYNAGSGLFGTVDDITPADFETSWRINALGALLASQAWSFEVEARPFAESW